MYVYAVDTFNETMVWIRFFLRCFSRIGSLELKIGSLESEKIIIGSQESKKIG